jgi:hypothetical protein
VSHVTTSSVQRPESRQVSAMADSYINPMARAPKIMSTCRGCQRRSKAELRSPNVPLQVLYAVSLLSHELPHGREDQLLRYMARGEKALYTDSLSSTSSRVGGSRQYAEQTPTVRELHVGSSAGRTRTRKDALPVAAKWQSFELPQRSKGSLGQRAATRPRHSHS